MTKNKANYKKSRRPSSRLPIFMFHEIKLYIFILKCTLMCTGQTWCKARHNSSLKGLFSVISGDPPCKEGKARFTTVLVEDRDVMCVYTYLNSLVWSAENSLCAALSSDCTQCTPDFSADHCKSCTPFFAWRVTWNYAYSPFSTLINRNDLRSTLNTYRNFQRHN